MNNTHNKSTMFASLCIKKRLTSRCLSLTSVSRSCMVPSFVFAVRQPDWLEPDITALQNLKSQFQETRSKYDNASFSDYFRHKIGYSSNKIEGNTLTESEVSTVLRGRLLQCGQFVPVMYVNLFV